MLVKMELTFAERLSKRHSSLMIRRYVVHLRCMLEYQQLGEQWSVSSKEN